MNITVPVDDAWRGKTLHFLFDANCEGLIHEHGQPTQVRCVQGALRDGSWSIADVCASCLVSLPHQGLTGGDGCDRRAEYVLTTNSERTCACMPIVV